MNGERIRDRFMPWAGIALGTLGGGLAHQIGADSTFQDCRVGSPAIVLVCVGRKPSSAGQLSGSPDFIPFMSLM